MELPRRGRAITGSTRGFLKNPTKNWVLNSGEQGVLARGTSPKLKKKERRRARRNALRQSSNRERTSHAFQKAWLRGRGTPDT